VPSFRSPSPREQVAHSLRRVCGGSSKGRAVLHHPKAFLSTLAALMVAVACSTSQTEEREMGAADAAKVDSQLPLVHDSAINAYINTLGHSLTAHTSRADLDWRFAVVNSPEVNAFALPGGFIYVNRGAIEQADRLDQLAGIMGHEVGHVVERHSVQQMQQVKKDEVGIVMLCTLTHVCRTIGGKVLVGVAAEGKRAHYSQHDEAQADSEGVVNTVRAGIDPEGLPSFFQKLLDKQAQEPTAVEVFFSTHPTDQSRVAATRALIAKTPGANNPALIRDTPEFHAIQERVKQLPSPPPEHAMSTLP
jgi:beta-barrel assembly-enhancing protease